MPAYWEIDVEGTRQDADAWGVTVASYFADNAGLETVTVEVDDPLDSTAISWAYGETMKIYRDSVKVFQGTITSTPRFGDDTKEGAAFQVSGPFWWLENITFRLPRNYRPDGSGSTVSKDTAYVLMMADQDGAAITTGAQMGAVIDMAIAKGAPITKGTIMTGSSFWTTPVKGVTCAEALNQCLSLHQDAGVWFDHSTTPPTMHVDTVDNMSAVNIVGDGSSVAKNLTVRDRSDLIPDSIVVEYEISTTIDGEQYLDIVQDIAPGTADGTEAFARFITIPLRGANVTKEYQQIQTVAIPLAGAVDLPAKQWLARNDSTLKDIAEEAGAGVFQLVAADQGDIAAIQTFNITETETDPDALNGVQRAAAAAAVSEIPNQLIKGQIPDWAEKKTGKVLLRCTVGLSAATIAGLSDTLKKEVKKKFTTRRELGATVYFTGLFNVTVNATEASTGTLSRTTRFDPAEQIPSGIAAAYYAGLNRSWYEGGFTLSEDEAWGTQYLGKKINVTGLRAEWATMGMPVQSVDIDVTSGETSVSFGPWGVMGVAAAVEQLRLSRSAPVEYQYEDDATEGKSTGNNIGSWSTTPEAISSGPATEDRPPDFWTEYDAAASQTWVYPGRLQYRHPTDGITEVTITVGGTTLADEPLALSGTGALKVRLNTDSDGIPTGNATVEFTTDTGQSHRPAEFNDADDGGQTGEYLWKIAQVGGTPVEITARRTGTIDYHVEDLEDDTCENVAGATQEIYIDDEDDGAGGTRPTQKPYKFRGMLDYTETDEDDYWGVEWVQNGNNLNAKTLKSQIVFVEDNPDGSGTSLIESVGADDPTSKDTTYYLRKLIEGSGVTITTDADGNLVLASTGSHPWKVTDAGSGNAAIAAGYFLGWHRTSLATFGTSAGIGPDDRAWSDDMVLGSAGSYSGGSVAITGTQYLYAEIIKNGPTDAYAATEGSADVIVETQLGDLIEPDSTDTITVTASSSAPSAYTPTTGDVAICIAKVTNTAGVISVDDQFITANEILQLIVVDSIVANNSL